MLEGIFTHLFNRRVGERGTIVRNATTEAQNRIDMIEQGHVYLRTVYEKLCVKGPSISTEDGLCLSF